MSDEQAEKKESELSKEKEAGEKAVKEKQSRIWTLTLAIDPETWEFEMFMNDKVKKQGQVDILLNAARKQVTLTSQARVIGEMVLRVMSAKPQKKGIFHRGR